MQSRHVSAVLLCALAFCTTPAYAKKRNPKAGRGVHGGGAQSVEAAKPPVPAETLQVPPAQATDKPLVPASAPSPAPDAASPAPVMHSSFPGEGVTPEAPPVVDKEPGVTVAKNTSEIAPAPKFPLTVEIHVGAIFPQLLSRLGTSPTPSVAVGYLLPVLDQRIELLAEAAYMQPIHDGTSVASAAIANGGSYTYTVVEREIVATAAARYRFFPVGTDVNFYAHLGAQAHFQRADVQGAASGSAFGNHQETATKLGGVVGGGAELALGPGAVAADLNFTGSPVDHWVTGTSTDSGLGMRVGYHFLF